MSQFLLPAVLADPTAYISQPSPSGGSGVSAAEAEKPIRVKVTGRKYMDVGADTSSSAVQVDGVSSAPLTSVDVMPSATSRPSLSELISHASAAAVVSSLIPPHVFTAVVAVTNSPVSTPVSSNVIPKSLFDSPIGIFPSSEKEMPTGSAAHEATSARDTAVSDAGGSSSGIDKRYQPKWKIAKSSRLIFPLVVHQWVERAYPPAESAYVEGLNNENLMNATMVDSVSQHRRLAEIRRRWMHDNNKLHQARVAMQELKDEKYHLESQLQPAGLRESRFVSEKKSRG
ncbi:hypothetical protein Hanom_Chr16g01427931 [Helianthus anomalus]